MSALDLMYRMRRCPSGVTAAFLQKALGVDLQHMLRVLVDLGMVERERDRGGSEGRGALRYVYTLSVSGHAWLDEREAAQ